MAGEVDCDEIDVPINVAKSVKLSDTEKCLKWRNFDAENLA